MSIFFVTSSLGEPHGSAKSARDFLRALLAVFNNVHAVSPLKEDFGSVAAGRTLSMPHWHCIPGKPKRDRLWRRAFRFPGNALSLARLRSAASGQIVIVNGWASFLYWKQLRLPAPSCSMIVIRESPGHFQFDDHCSTQEEAVTMFSEFDRLIFVSESSRQTWMGYSELRGKPAFTLPNCCEEEEIEQIRRRDREEVRRRLGIHGIEFVAVVPGNIEKRKGQDTVLEALSCLVKDIPQLRILMLGNPGNKWARALISKVEAGVFGNQVTWRPAQPSALEYLFAADVLLFPSKAESLPRTILEGMAFGMPIVSTNVDGIPELVEHGVSAFLFEPNNVDAMRDGLTRIARDPEIGELLSTAARDRYYSCYSREQQIRRAELLRNWILEDTQCVSQ